MNDLTQSNSTHADNILSSNFNTKYSDINIQIKLSLDKVVLAFPVSDQDQLMVKTNIDNLMQELNGQGKLLICSNKSGYRRSLSFTILNKEKSKYNRELKVLVSTQPVSQDRAYVLVDFNVRKLSTKGGANLRRILHKIFGKKLYRRIICDSYFTHREYSVDIYDIKISDLLLYKKLSRKTKMYKSGSKFMLAESCLEVGSDGEIMTIYFNSQRSRLSIKEYNKKDEVNKRRKKAGNTDLLTREITRIEVVCKGKYRLKDMANYKLPQAQLLILSESMLQDVVKGWDAFKKAAFKDVCRVRGFHNAIKLLPINEQRAFRYRFNKVKPFIDLDEVYNDQMEAMLSKLKFLKMEHE